MQFKEITPPRGFRVGSNGELTLYDTGRISLDPNEQVSFAAGDAGDFRLVRESWGYCWPAHLNADELGMRAVLAKGPGGATFFLLLVERGKEQDMNKFVEDTGTSLVCWLDSDESFVKLDNALTSNTVHD